MLCPLSDFILCNQHNAEPRLALHHASVGIRSLFERNCLDHRADILKDAESQGVLATNRGAGQATPTPPVFSVTISAVWTYMCK